MISKQNAAAMNHSRTARMQHCKNFFDKIYMTDSKRSWRIQWWEKRD